MKKFSKIQLFHNVVKTVGKLCDYKKMVPPTILYRGTVKLHGTNAGLRRNISDTGEVTFICQSRNNVAGPGLHYGFPEFISEIPVEDLNKLFDTYFGPGVSKATLYGEWVGPGIQDKVAVSKLEKKHWALFSGTIGDGDDADHVANVNQHAHLEERGIYNVLRAPKYYIEVDFTDPAASIPTLEQITIEVEAECPYGKTFGVSGIGEGIVWIPVEDKYFQDSDYWFKTKGDKHSHSDKRQKVGISPKVAKDIADCVDKILTERRLEQGLDYLKEMNLEADMRSLGTFLKYVGKDLQIEEGDTVEASGLEWKKVWKEASNKAKKWYVLTIKRGV